MCGLVGFATSKKYGFDKLEFDTLSIAMYLNELRGRDSTGMFSVDNNKEADFIKEVGSSASLYRHTYWEKFAARLRLKGKIVVGHGRSATRGIVSKENAHPFLVYKPDNLASVIMVHNGTLEYQQDLPGFNQHTVDSEWLAHCLVKYGAEETFSKVNGAIACIWWDGETEELCFFRNSQRPLHIAFEKDGTLHLNSEEAPLAYMEKKFYLHFNKDGIQELNTNNICSIPFKDLGSIKSSEDIPCKEVKKATRKHFQTGMYKDHGDDYYMYGRPKDPYIPASQVFSYNDDVESFRNGTIYEIVWNTISGRRVHKNSKNATTWDTDIPQAPHHENLYRWLLDGDKIKTFYRNSAGSEWEGVIKLSDEKAVVKTPQLLTATEPVPKIGNFRKGQGCKFRTKFGEGHIKHKVLSSKEHELRFEKYENDVDGKFYVGQGDVVIEVYDVEERKPSLSGGETFCKATGILLTKETKMSNVIDLVFYTKMAKETVEKLGIFRGTIADIKLALPEETVETGAIVNMRLKEISPVHQPEIKRIH